MAMNYRQPTAIRLSAPLVLVVVLAALPMVWCFGCSSSTSSAGDASIDRDAGRVTDGSKEAAPGGSGGEGAAGFGGNGGSGGMAGSSAAGSGGAAGSAGAAGATGQGDSGVGPNEPTCREDADCDDGIDCTTDQCIRERCSHAIDASSCETGEACDPRAGGCGATAVCGQDADCSDDDPCTQNETCDTATAQCLWDLLDSDGDMHAPAACGGDDADDSDDTHYPGAPDVCDGIDNDQDGSIDEEPSATESCPDAQTGEEVLCQQGRCQPQCTEPMRDCDEDAKTGCETNVASSVDHCGTCGYSCDTCSGGTCLPGACHPERNVILVLYGGLGLDFGFTSVWNAHSHCMDMCMDQEQSCLTRCLDEIHREQISEGCLDCFQEASPCVRERASCSEDCFYSFNECAGISYGECAS